VLRHVIAFIALVALSQANDQALQLISSATDGGFSNGGSLNYGSAVSEDGRLVVFESTSTNLVKDDTNAKSDIFIRDVRKGTTERISLGFDGTESNGDSVRPSLSSDGHYVVFWSNATNLVSGDTNGKWDVFLRDLRKGTTERISVTSAGAESTGDPDADIPPSISRNGKYVVWGSQAANLVTEGSKTWNVYLRDREKVTTELVSKSESGAVGDGDSIQPTISDDGSTIAFRTAATNLVPGDTNKSWDIVVKSRVRKTLQCATLDYRGAFGQASKDGPTNYPPSLSADGVYLAFDSSASDLVPGDTNGRRDVFVRDLKSGLVVRVSVGPGGSEANGASNYPSISADGRIVAFESLATNLVQGDQNRCADVFVCNVAVGTVFLVSTDANGAQGARDSLTARISGDGQWIVYRSEASNLLPGDRNAQSDVFILELGQ